MTRMRSFFCTLLLMSFVGSPLTAAERTKEEKRALKKLMKTWSRSLGVKCRYCHNTKDFKAWTPHRRIANAMNQVFVKGLKHPKSGGEVVCGDCHSGDIKPDAEKLKVFPSATMKGLVPEMERWAKQAPEPQAKEALTKIAERLGKL